MVDFSGESVPVTKTPISQTDASPYDQKAHAKNTLFCGTKVLQTRQSFDALSSLEPVKAVCIRTGYLTTKGQLIRTIMYPKPVDFHFTNDLLKMVRVLSVIALGGFIYTVVIMVERGNGVERIVLRSLDMITTVVSALIC